MAKFKGFEELLRKKFKRKREQEEEKKTGRPAWVKKLSGSDRARWEAVHKANLKRKKK